MFQIADIFDALSHHRPYKTAWGVEQTLEYLNQLAVAGALDPDLVNVFCDMATHIEPQRRIA